MGRKPTIKGEAEFLGKGVSYCAICDVAFYKGKTVCVIGDSEEGSKRGRAPGQNLQIPFISSRLHQD